MMNEDLERTNAMQADDRQEQGSSRSADGRPARSLTASEKAALVRVTTVHTLYREGRKNFRALFGTPLRTETLARDEGYTAKVLSFVRGDRFALDLWTCNSYGTIQWRCFVCEAIGPGEDGARVPCVAPAARLLLHTRGAAQSRLFLAWLLDLEESGVDPLRCPQETFEAVHFRLQGSRADKTPARRLSGHP
jgi:hypothetical protein